MKYPILVHKDKDSDCGVIVPDLPGCSSTGRTIDEAVAMAQKGIEFHLEGPIEAGDIVPKPGDIQCHAQNPDYQGGIGSVVSIDPSHVRVSAKRVNITMPQRVLDALNRVAGAEHETRSGLLVKAVTAYVRRGSAGRKPAETVATTRRKRKARAGRKGHVRT